MKRGVGGCLGPREPPEGLSMSCLELLHAIDIAVVTLEGNFFLIPGSHDELRHTNACRACLLFSIFSQCIYLLANFCKERKVFFKKAHTAIM